MIELEIDGQQLSVIEGTSIIEAAESIGVYIPRYCYHKKLSIAANCRMCLVEVERVGKPLPACATPVTQDMKVFTRSLKAIEAQRDVLEFLLVNHPLDCPICDQGGVCELQDFAMGYGKGRSHFSEDKIAVSRTNLGPLIETWMNRCIKCTRCVRFGEEIAGVRELGLVHRGEKSTISAYLSSFVDSELSANITDICPVGALTLKPTRYQARNWELQEQPGISPHDCVGTNVYFHTQGKAHFSQRKVVSIVPRENDAINESWISDRDRFAYLGVEHAEYCTQPMIKQNNQWKTVTWSRVLPEIVDRLTAVIQNQGADQLAFLASPDATTEEFYLLQKLSRSLGCDNVDHRVRQQDFHESEVMLESALGLSLEEIENCDQIVLIGSNIRHEQPLVAHRVRQATIDETIVSVINPRDFDFGFVVDTKDITNDLICSTMQLAKALGIKDEAFSAVDITEHHLALAKALLEKDEALILFGLYAIEHPQAMTLKAIAQRIEAETKIKVGWLTSGANTAGAWRAGMVPHRGSGGEKLAQPGKSALEVLSHSAVRAYVLLQLEVDRDVAFPAAAMEALGQAGLVVCLSSFASESMLSVADFILPVTPYMHNAGSYINVSGQEQAFVAASVPHDEAKPAWKIIRALANFFDLEGFSHPHVQAVRKEMKSISYSVEQVQLPLARLEAVTGLQRYARVPIYDLDMLVRRSRPLSESNLKEAGCIMMHSSTVSDMQLKAGVSLVVCQGDSEVCLKLVINDALAEGLVDLPAGVDLTAGFGQGHGPIEIKEVLC